MWGSFQRALVVTLAGIIIGLAANAVSPRGIPYITPPKPVIDESEYIPLEEAFQLWGSGAAIFLDARAPADYAAGHIAGAFNVPAQAFHEHFPAVAPYLSPSAHLICYCDGVQCDLSHELAELLRQQGFTNIHLLQNAWTVWREAGYPTQP